MKLKNYALKPCRLFVMAAFAFTANCYSQTNVTTDTQLQTLVNSAAPGAVFVIPNGTYPDFYASFTKVATAANPITIKAQTVGGVTLTGDSHFVFKKSAYIILEGFVFDCQSTNTLVKLEASNNIRITRNVFELTTTSAIKWLLIGGYYNDYTYQFLSHHNRIDHNTFQNKNTAGNYITIDGTYNQAQTEGQQSQYDVIDHNYFYNNGPRLENENESIRIGNSKLSQSNGYTTVEFNLFSECDGDPEIVSVKSCDNVIRHNTFTRSYGSLTLRQGNRNRAEGNYFFGGGKAGSVFGETLPINTGGIRAYGTDHVIVNNYLEGLQGTLFDAPIVLTQGDAIDGVDTDFGLHYRPERVTVAYNTLVNNKNGIELGYAKSDGSYDIKMKDITIANNLVTGSQNPMVKVLNDQLGEITWINNIMYPTGSAQLATGATFTAGQVSVQNPNLVQSGTIWKATATSPIIAGGVPSLNITQDIDGQTRPATSNAGADHYSTSAASYFPVTINDVGPGATETDMPVAGVANFAAMTLKMYPNPTQGKLELIVPEDLAELPVSIYTIYGQLLTTATYTVTNGKAMLDMSNQPAGVYVVQVTVNGKPMCYKIVKQ
jgi:poly(beta-D-mannuronate) lyase